MQETIKHLDELLTEGRTEEILEKRKQLMRVNVGHWEYSSPQEKSEVFAIEGMAYYLRKDFALARNQLEEALALDPRNERAICGMAYLAAYDKDFNKLEGLMAKLTDGAAKDNAKVIFMRSDEYRLCTKTYRVEDEIEAILKKYMRPDLDDRLNTANVLHNTGRLLIVLADDYGVERREYEDFERQVRYLLALGLLQSAIGLYGIGDQLHHRAAANYWMSVAMEKLFGQAAALASAEQSVDLWARQLALDPQNPHYKKSWSGSCDRLHELQDAASAP